MVILRVSAPTLVEVYRTLESHEGFFDGFEIQAESLQHPEQEDWEGFTNRVKCLRILALPGRDAQGIGPSPALCRSLVKRRLFDMVRIPIEKDRGGEGACPQSLEEEARRHRVGVIRSIDIDTGEKNEIPSFPLPVLEGLDRKRDVLHLSMHPSGWKEIGPLLERVILDSRILEWGGRRSFSVEGPVGFPFQVLASYLGSCFTFTYPKAAGPLLDPITLQRVYRYPSIGSHTALFGIIGNPVLHSRSPHIHNRGYEALGIDAVYVPFPVDDLESFFHVARKLRIRGLSVTIPHKEKVIKFCSWCEEAVHAVGACNTLVLSEDSIKGYNTDVEGFLAPLRGSFHTLQGLRALVIGAGGASRSVVYGLAREGARVLILNRTVERALGLAKDMERALGLSPGTIMAGPLNGEGILKEEQFIPDLVVQTTSCGMHPREDEDPFPELSFRGQEVVYDLVYTPRETRFLKRAKAKGCSVIYGDSMLLHQAFRQFLLFTGREYPRQLMEGM
jgi:shikimate dehydrogenase